MSAPDRRSTLVIGIGSEDSGDDEAGLLVARLLGGHPIPGVAAVESDGDTSELLEAWKGSDCAILVEVMISGPRPGTVRRFDASARPLPSSLFAPASSHRLDLPGAVELGRALHDLPPRLLVYGIRGGDFHAGEGVSPAVARGVECAVRRIEREITRTGRARRTRATGQSPGSDQDRGSIGSLRRGTWRTA